MSNGDGFLSSQLSHRAHVLGLRLWEVIALAFAALTVLILFFLALRLQALRWSSKSRKQQLYPASTDGIADSPIPVVSKEIKVVQVSEGTLSLSRHLAAAQAESASFYKLPTPSASRVSSWGRHSAVDILDDEKQVVTFTYGGGTEVELPSFRSIRHPKSAVPEAAAEMQQSQINSMADSSSDVPPLTEHSDPIVIVATEPKIDCASTCSSAHSAYYDDCRLYNEGCRSKKYSMEALEKATGWFAEGNILGKGGYGVVYRGLLPDGSAVAVKHLIDVSRNQMAEFRVEVEAISCIRHKNLVGLLGYCAQGPNRLLIYEYVDNGNLDQWLHGPLGTSQPIPWNRRMNIVLGTAKGLAYLHEDLEPKVVHRDVKASNILLDRSWNAKISDFGLAKLLGDGKTHVTTRVMGTFGYVAPEYASTGLLTESSDVYSFGVLMMEVITGRDPVDYSKPAREMNVVEWTKRMVESKRWEDVADPRLPEKPLGRALKRALLVALRCVDPDALHRPRMGHVVYMLEADDLSFHHVCKNRRNADGHLTARSFRQVNGPDG